MSRKPAYIAQNFYCYLCAYDDNVLQNAEAMVYIPAEGKVLPLCTKHIYAVEHESFMGNIFLN